MDKRGGGGKEVGSIKIFRQIFFCLTVPKNFVGEPFSVSLISGNEKFYASEGYVTIFDFLSKFFCLTVPKIFVGESFTVALISGTENVWRKGGEYQDFPSKIFCLTVPKIFVGESFIVALISGTEKVWRRGGVSRFSVEIVLSHSTETFRKGILQCFIKFGCRKSLWIRGGEGGREYQDIPSKIFCRTVPKKFVGESFSNSINSGIEKC